MIENKKLENLRNKIADLVKKYSKEKYKSNVLLEVPNSSIWEINRRRRNTKYGSCIFGWMVDHW